MNINMKRNFFMMAFVCLFTVVALCSCSKDDDDNSSVPDPDIVVENGSSYNALIDVVKLEVYSNSTGKYQTLASAEYKNGFTLTLPESVSSQYLESLGDDVPAGVTVSNKNVKTGTASLNAYKSDSEAGYFYHKSGDWEGELMYADGDVSVTGTETDTDEYEGTTYTLTIKYSVNLKKGWNRVYQKWTENGNNETVEITTTTPSGATWHFESYGSGGESSVSGARAKKSLFNRN
jgi:hypothetical protein